jgi:hypothetical protein
MKKTRAAKRKPGTHFEQIPLEIVKLIAIADNGNAGNARKTKKSEKKTGPGTVFLDSPAGKTEPYSMPRRRLTLNSDQTAARQLPDSGDVVVRAEQRGKTRTYVLHTLHGTPAEGSYEFRERKEGIAQAIPIGERLGVRVWLSMEGHVFELLEDFRPPASRLKASVPRNR